MKIKSRVVEEEGCHGVAKHHFWRMRISWYMISLFPAFSPLGREHLEGYGKKKSGVKHTLTVKVSGQMVGTSKNDKDLWVPFMQQSTLGGGEAQLPFLPHPRGQAIALISRCPLPAN